MSKSTSPGVFDAVILGTSPVLLIEGLLRARTGQQVVFVSDDQRIGGIWVGTELDEVRDIESACLLLENYRGAYQFLQDTLGIPLELTSPAPTLLTARGRVIAYNSRRRTIGKMLAAVARLPVVALVRIIEALSLGRLRVRRTARFRFAAAIRKLGILLRHPMAGDRAVRYLVGGAPQMLARLQAELQQLGASFVQGRARSLEIRTGEVELQLEDNQHLRAREFVGGESTSLESVRANGQQFDFEVRELVYQHLIIEADGMPADCCSYVQMPSDPYIARFNDVTGFCRRPERDSNTRILIVQTLQPTDDDLETRARDALSYLVERRLLPASVTLRRCRSADIHSQKATPAVAVALRRMRLAEIVILPSLGDLSLTLLQNKHRWQALIDRAIGVSMPHEQAPQPRTDARTRAIPRSVASGAGAR